MTTRWRSSASRPSPKAGPTIEPPAVRDALALSGEVILGRKRDAAGRRTVANRSVWIAGRQTGGSRRRTMTAWTSFPSASAMSRGHRCLSGAHAVPGGHGAGLRRARGHHGNLGAEDLRTRARSGIPVKGQHAPTCLFRCWPYAPRREVQPRRSADLGKPAFKLGIAEISVAGASMS